LHNEELRDAYFPPNVVRVMKSWMMRWAGRVVCGGVEKCMGVWWENLEGKRPIGTPDVDGRLTLTLSLLMSYICIYIYI
jgi:hypothetical protein